MPPLAEALKASIPIVALVQEVARDQTDRNAFQELDHIKLFSGCAKWVKTVTVASRIEDYIDMAFAAAASGRPGPAVLMLPADLLTEHLRLRYARTQAHSARSRSIAWRPTPTGSGGRESARRSRAAADHRRWRCAFVRWHARNSPTLQEACSLPVATTVMGKGTVCRNDIALRLGVVGYFMGTNGRTRHLRQLVTDADVVLLVGNRTNQNGTDSWQLYPNGRALHPDRHRRRGDRPQLRSRGPPAR